jgi:glycosyltransferase involved in cell wall biosynthesis
MRIGIDTHFINSERATGNHTYTAELVRALIAADKRNVYLLYGEGDHPYYRQFDDNPQVRTRLVLSRRGVIRNFVSLPRAIAHDQLDVLHLQYILPPFTHIPSVLAIHDLYYLHSSQATRYQQAVMRLSLWSARRSTQVTTLSEYSKQDIVRRTGIDPDRVIVTPLGVSNRFAPDTNSGQLGAVQHWLGLKGRYILFVGRTDDPRKNLSTLIRAYAALIANGEITEQLVIVGRRGPGSLDITSLIRELGLDRWVIMPGEVEDADLPALFAEASIFVYVSSFEGFGLPVLEAMASGTPVITSNVTSLPEVAGTAALLVTPGKVEELASAIRSLLGDTRLRLDLRERGLARARQFSWERTAQQFLKIFEMIGRQPGR